MLHDIRHEVEDFDAANLECSVRADGDHDIVIDLDGEHEYRPSATPGHGHLIIHLDNGLAWPGYRRLLEALAQAGVITSGYLAQSVRRRASFVRRAGVYKSPEEVARAWSYDQGVRPQPSPEDEAEHWRSLWAQWND